MFLRCNLARISIFLKSREVISSVQTHIDELIIGHTNEPEYRKLQSNEFMEALRDRTVKVDVPYITRLSDEIQIYKKDYGPNRVQGKHMAPHTMEMAAMWAVLTRLKDPKKANLTLLQKLKLYNGKTLPGFTEENIKELKDEAEREGMEGRGIGEAHPHPALPRRGGG